MGVLPKKWCISKALLVAALGLVGIILYGHGYTASKSESIKGKSLHDNLFERHSLLATPQEAWLQKRQAMLEKGGPKKVILFCYARGGSTFFSELFRKNPDALFWYEPLAGLYTSMYGLNWWNLPLDILFDESTGESGKKIFLRDYPDWEKEAVVQMHHNLVNCAYGDLPVEFLVHTRSLPKTSGTLQYQKCLKANNIGLKGPCGYWPRQSKLLHVGLPECGLTVANANRQNCSQKIVLAQKQFQDTPSYISQRFDTSQSVALTETELQTYINHSICLENIRGRLKVKCTEVLDSTCRNAKLVVYKALRLRMDMVQNILENDPNTQVIFYVRDPRGIAVSRKEAQLMSVWARGRVPLEAKYLCEKMRHDLNTYSVLSKLYPGAMKMIRYEDLAQEPKKISNELYDFIGVPIHEDVENWIARSQISVKNGDRYSTNRQNWTASIGKWAANVTHRGGIDMNYYCKDVLSALGYSVS